MARTIYQAAAATAFTNPNRKLLLLGLVELASEHIGAVLREGMTPFFEFHADPVYLQDLVGSSAEIVTTHLTVLQNDGWLEYRVNYKSAIDWVYVIKLNPIYKRLVR